MRTIWRLPGTRSTAPRNRSRRSLGRLMGSTDIRYTVRVSPSNRPALVVSTLVNR